MLISQTGKNNKERIQFVAADRVPLGLQDLLSS